VSFFNEFWISSPVTSVVITGALALLLILLFFRQPKSLPLAENESGKLLISRRALHRMVEACCENVRGVAAANASINIKGSQFNTRLRLKIRPEAKLDAIQGYLTQEITHIYRENLGLSSEIGPIEIKVVGVIPADPSF